MRDPAFSQLALISIDLGFSDPEDGTQSLIDAGLLEHSGELGADGSPVLKITPLGYDVAEGKRHPFITDGRLEIL